MSATAVHGQILLYCIVYGIIMIMLDLSYSIVLYQGHAAMRCVGSLSCYKQAASVYTLVQHGEVMLCPHFCVTSCMHQLPSEHNTTKPDQPTLKLLCV